MSASAWIFLIVTWSGIVTLTIYCFAKMLRAPALEQEEPDEIVRPTP